MAVSELKLHFGSLLRSYLKRAGVKQLTCARELNVTPAAVSQMISGRMVPNIKQLEVIISLISLDRAEASELRDCLLRIRSGEELILSPLNNFIRNTRVARGYSIAQLARVSGISEETLTLLETSMGAQPTPTEAMRLATVLDCNLSELMKVEQRSGDICYHPLRDGNNYSEGDLPIKTPIVPWNALRVFDVQVDEPVDFAWRHLSKLAETFDEGCIVVKADGPDINWPMLCELELEVFPKGRYLPGIMVLGAWQGKVQIGEFVCEGEESDPEVIAMRKLQVNSSWEEGKVRRRLIKVRANDQEFYLEWAWPVGRVNMRSVRM